MLSDQQLKCLLVEVHKAIEEAADDVSSQFSSENIALAYPPNGGLTLEEKKAISQIKSTPILQSAFRKIIAAACAYPMFHLFLLMDGVADPEDIDELWMGCEFAAMDDSANEGSKISLHDEFYASYWEWREKRQDKTWKLDNL